ncbi:hypothetical protein BDV96DRAFT_596469 [Lophiotrema nucula]|uniref:Uncharacterized protein n=1 Tax=Lophiotrema nucula TaxID=690887 RepID=A0A6A5ZKB3_9PLEO|nr:hypothetical protein BDV96DRAFT_596469 [Lophiotrema nucula]
MANTGFRFQDLPRELRNRVYKLAVEPQPNDPPPLLFRGQRRSRLETYLEIIRQDYTGNPLVQPEKPLAFELLNVLELRDEFRPVYIANQHVRISLVQIMKYLEDWYLLREDLHDQTRGKIFVDVCEDNYQASVELKALFEFCLEAPRVEITFGCWHDNTTVKLGGVSDLLNTMARTRSAEWMNTLSSTLSSFRVIWRAGSRPPTLKRFGILVEKSAWEPWMKRFNDGMYPAILEMELV